MTLTLLTLFFIITISMLFTLSETISTLNSTAFEEQHKKSHIVILVLLLIIPLNVLLPLIQEGIVSKAIHGGMWIPSISYSLMCIYLTIHLRQERKEETTKEVTFIDTLKIIIKKLKQLITLKYN